MKYLKVLSLVIILAFSSAILAQEKETEKPKEVEKSKEVEKPKEEKLNDAFRKSNDPHGFIVRFWTHRGIPASLTNNQPADVTDVEMFFENPIHDELDGNLCSPKISPMLEIITKAVDKEDDTITYNYTVSGGKIIGSGEKVIWDLSGVKPGTYTITAAVDDGCGFCGKTMTKTVTVKE